MANRTAAKPSILGLVLCASLLLRVVLALQGGQNFYGDEPRYFRGPVLYKKILAGEWEWVRAVLTQPEHAGFTYIVLLVAPIHHALAVCRGLEDWLHPENSTASLPLAAAVLGVFSTLNLWLIHRLALQSGASEREAETAALLAAASGSLFYYSRHLLPYDCSLTFALSGLICSLSARDRVRQFLGGVCAGWSFAVYNGYWFMVPVLGWCLLHSQPTWSARVRAGFTWILGLGATIGLVALPGTVLAGGEYWVAAVRFSGTVTQGVFAEGWSLPWAYLWATESWAGAAVAGLAITAVLRDILHGTRPQRVWLWISAAAGIYFLLVLPSVGLEKFVVYARTSRTLVPFFCLIGAYAIESLLSRRPSRRPLVIVAVLLAGAANIAPVFSLTYPGETKQRVWQEFGVPKEALSFSGSFVTVSKETVTRPDLALVNAQLVYPLDRFIGYPAGHEIFSVLHAQNFLPYQYDGLTPRERHLLREHPAYIKLIKLASPSALPDRPETKPTVGRPASAEERRERP